MLIDFVTVLNRRLLPDKFIMCSWTFLVPPETLRDYETILPGSADRILSLADRQQMQRARFERRILIFGFILFLALIALSAYSVSLGFAWEAVVIIYSGIAGAFFIFVYK